VNLQRNHSRLKGIVSCCGRYGLYGLAAALLWAGCHMPRAARKAKSSAVHEAAVSARMYSPETVFGEMQKNRIRYQTFSARARLDINGPHGSQKGIATFIRVRRDSAIWVSVRPLLGIEMIRALITPDSIRILNLLKKTLTVRSTDSMQRLLHLPVGYEALEDLLVGNPVGLSSAPRDIRLNPDSSLLEFTCDSGSFQGRYRVLTPAFQLQQAAFSMPGDASQERYQADQQFQEYKPVEGTDFSTVRHLNIHAGSDLQVDIHFNHVSFDAPLDFPFPESDHFSRN